jgi:hypothetical protein
MLRKICGEGFVAEKLMAQNPRHKICGSVFTGKSVAQNP